MNSWDQMLAAMRDARNTMSAADQQASEMARMLAENGRLRKCSAYQLRQLKKQLRDFNSVTGKWKNA